MNIEDLKHDSLLGNLEDYQLEKVVPLLTAHHFIKGDQITFKGKKAEDFFMLVSGKIFLEQRISEDMTHTVATINEGQSFGWASIFNKGKYISEAFAASDCLVYSLKGSELKKLLEDDNSMGYRFMKNLLLFLNSRVARRTEQFVNAIKTHPDFIPLEL